MMPRWNTKKICLKHHRATLSLTPPPPSTVSPSVPDSQASSAIPTDFSQGSIPRINAPRHIRTLITHWNTTILRHHGATVSLLPYLHECLILGREEEYRIRRQVLHDHRRDRFPEYLFDYRFFNYWKILTKQLHTIDALGTLRCHDFINKSSWLLGFDDDDLIGLPK